MIQSLKQYILFSIFIFLLTSCAVNKKLISVNNFNSHAYTPQAKLSLLKSIITNDSLDKLALTKTPIFTENTKITKEKTSTTKSPSTIHSTNKTTSQEINPVHKNKIITNQPKVKQEELPMSANAILGFLFTAAGFFGFLGSLFFLSNPIFTLSLLIFLPVGKILRILGNKEIKKNQKRGKGFVLAGRILEYTIISAFIITLILLYIFISNLDR